MPEDVETILEVHVVPRASRNEICGMYGSALKVRLQAPPVDGQANAALIKFLADKISVPTAALELISGGSGRRKCLRIKGLSSQAARSRLGI